jgi:hypothetical protein
MASENTLWGYRRIRGELLKLAIVSALHDPQSPRASADTTRAV